MYKSLQDFQDPSNMYSSMIQDVAGTACPPTELLGARWWASMAGNLTIMFSASHRLAHVSLKKDIRGRSSMV